jgi:hypothetical protein
VKLQVGRYYKAKIYMHAIPVGSIHLCVHEPSGMKPEMLRVWGCGKFNNTSFHWHSTENFEEISDEEVLICKMSEET